MAILRYNSWSEVDSVQRQINRLFNEAPSAKLAETNNYSPYPLAELTEVEESLILKLELPGMKLEDIEIEAAAKSISIKGERTSQVATKNLERTGSEFRYGSFQRVISLPVRIQNTEVKAQYQEGILYLTLPKAEAEKNKVVKVNLLGESNG